MSEKFITLHENLPKQYGKKFHIYRRRAPRDIYTGEEVAEDYHPFAEQDGEETRHKEPEQRL